MVSVAGGIFIALTVLLVVGGVGWVAFTQLRARKLGLPPPSFSFYIPFRTSSFNSASSNLTDWFSARLRAFKNRNNRSATGAYEQPLQRSHARPGGALDPDEAWDARVGQEADGYGPAGYYEEQPGQEGTAYRGGSYAMNLAATPAMPQAGFGEETERGRERGRSPGLAPAGPRKNPFDDDAEPSNLSMRGVSPRPIETGVQRGGQEVESADTSSPTERRSMFRENV